jgi:hypothetical protein
MSEPKGVLVLDIPNIVLKLTKKNYSKYVVYNGILI